MWPALTPRRVGGEVFNLGGGKDKGQFFQGKQERVIWHKIGIG